MSYSLYGTKYSLYGTKYKIFNIISNLNTNYNYQNYKQKKFKNYIYWKKFHHKWWNFVYIFIVNLYVYGI